MHPPLSACLHTCACTLPNTHAHSLFQAVDSGLQQTSFIREHVGDLLATEEDKDTYGAQRDVSVHVFVAESVQLSNNGILGPRVWWGKR